MSTDKVITLCFRMLENPIFRMKYEFTPEYKAPVITPYSAILPFPTTFLGLLYNLLLDLNPNAGNPLTNIWDDFEIDFNNRLIFFRAYDEILRAIPSLNNALKQVYGPYLALGEDSKSLGRKFVTISISAINDAIVEITGATSNLKKSFEEESKYIPYEMNVGIDLNAKTKIVEEGYTYIVTRPLLKGWLLCIDLVLNTDLTLSELNGKIVRLGTRGAKARLEIYQNADSLYSKAQEILNNKHKNDKYSYVVISPAILFSTSELKDWNLVKGKIASAAVGFSLKKKVKRPMVPVLLTGSQLEGNKKTLYVDINLSKYGFGCLYPL